MRRTLMCAICAGMLWATPVAAQGLGGFEIPMPDWDQPYQSQDMDRGLGSVPDYHSQYLQEEREYRRRQEQEHRQWMADFEADKRAREAEAAAERRHQEMLEIERERNFIEQNKAWSEQMWRSRCLGRGVAPPECR